MSYPRINELPDEVLKVIEEELKKRAEQRKIEYEVKRWTPVTKGDYLLGQVINIRETKKGAKILFVRTKNGEIYSTPPTGNLTKQIDELNVQIDDYVYIEFLGETTSEDGKYTYRNFVLAKLSPDEISNLLEIKNIEKKANIDIEQVKEKVKGIIKSFRVVTKQDVINYLINVEKIPLSPEEISKIIEQVAEIRAVKDKEYVYLKEG